MVQPSVPGVRFSPVRHGANPSFGAGGRIEELATGPANRREAAVRTWLELGPRAGCPARGQQSSIRCSSASARVSSRAAHGFGCGVHLAQRSGTVGDACLQGGLLRAVIDQGAVLFGDLVQAADHGVVCDGAPLVPPLDLTESTRPGARRATRGGGRHQRGPSDNQTRAVPPRRAAAGKPRGECHTRRPPAAPARSPRWTSRFSTLAARRARIRSRAATPNVSIGAPAPHSK